ncbi:endoplasmic reticulum-Golgi intermediate compartment protein 3, partial [Tanacetum coccineum]
MVAGLNGTRPIVVHVLVHKWYDSSNSAPLYSIGFFLLFSNHMPFFFLQTAEDCCNSCEDVREAYRAKGWALSDPDSIDQCKREGFLQSIKDEAGEGCNIYGFLDVNKVAGNFHFAPGKSFRESNIHVHDLAAFHKDSFNVSHKINRIAYGEYFPGVVNPLDG